MGVVLLPFGQPGVLSLDGLTSVAMRRYSQIGEESTAPIRRALACLASQT